MVQLTKSTKSVKEKEIKREWRIFDAKNQTVGRLVSDIIKYLTGKNKVNYVPYLDMGDFIVVINARDVSITGDKADTKVYSRYSGYPGGLTQITFKNLKKVRPAEIIRHAVMGMLPKNKLRDRRITRLFVYADDKHPYSAKFKT